MSIRTWGFATLAGCALVACATTPTADTQIRDLEQQQVHAALGRDRTTLQRLFAPDFRIINPSGAVASKEDLLKLLIDGAAPYQSAVYVTETVKIYGPVAVSTGLETVVPAQGAQAGQQVRRRITHVWERDGSSWRLALRQATIVTAP